MEAKKDEREELRQGITLGETICIKLKSIYFDQTKWNDCVNQVAALFTTLKRKARQFYVGRSELEMLKELAKYSQEDIKEMMDDQQ